MAKSVSEQLTDRKRKKFERELASELSKWGGGNLKRSLSSAFSGFSTPPTANELVKMVSASKFGGKSFLLQAPILFDHAINQFNSIWDGKLKEGITHWDLRTNTSVGFCGTVLNCFYVEKSLANHIKQIDISSLKPMPEFSPYLLLDAETQSYGVLAYLPDEANIHGSLMHGVFDWLKIGHWKIAAMPWETEEYPEWRISPEYTTGPLEYVSTMICIIATTEELLERLPERQQHSVSEHIRHLKSGKQTSVKAHAKRTPIRTQIRKTGMTDHVVYTVKDANGSLRYIGEGQKDRPNHVNSGASHNWKINEHYFKVGPMEIEIVADGLTKTESVAIEKILIQNNSHLNLWNVKDYEPFVDQAEKIIKPE